MSRSSRSNDLRSGPSSSSSGVVSVGSCASSGFSGGSSNRRLLQQEVDWESKISKDVIAECVGARYGERGRDEQGGKDEGSVIDVYAKAAERLDVGIR